MSYTAFTYLFGFLPLVWLAWALLPQRWRPCALLAGSLLFYSVTAAAFLPLVLLTALAAWGTGRVLAGTDSMCGQYRAALTKEQRGAFVRQLDPLRKAVLVLGVGVPIALFCWYKYGALVVETYNKLLAHLPGVALLAVPRVVSVFGLSFFSLMAISYVVDVYWERVDAAQHYWQVLLYVCFWGHIVEGPFDRYGDLAAALTNPPRPSYRAVCFGAQRMAWGMFKKCVIADRANMYVKDVFANWQSYSGAVVVLGILLYTLQLYTEFSGCMDIAAGSAELFGIQLAPNFRQPFFAVGISDFWRRWHCSLGAWLREYVFQPLVMSKPLLRLSSLCIGALGIRVARKIPVVIGLFVSWVLIGLWHGTALNFLAYGLYYFALQLPEELLPLLQRSKSSCVGRAVCRGYTFCMVNLGMLLFRANGGQAAVAMLKSVVVPYGGAPLIRLDAQDMLLLALGAAAVLLVDLYHERSGIGLRERIAAFSLPVRWIAYSAPVLATLVFGAYGGNYDPAEFIYAQF